ncbi:MAG: TPM domain-containing protein, partial [Gemmatimonadaceae bacterium]|nr:TPM domain-containing protein [Gemmatimonadaceae bacterium]
MFMTGVLSRPMAALIFPFALQIQVPQPAGLVNDFANVLTAESVDLMTRIAEDVRTKSRGEITIVTLADLDGRDPADVAREIGRQWKLGKSGEAGDATRNAGAVILLVPKETSSDGRGHCRVETGLGTEGFIRDSEAGDICRAATPAFIQKDYSAGLSLVALLTAQRFATEFNFALDTA